MGEANWSGRRRTLIPVAKNQWVGGVPRRDCYRYLISRFLAEAERSVRPLAAATSETAREPQVARRRTEAQLLRIAGRQGQCACRCSWTSVSFARAVPVGRAGMFRTAGTVVAASCVMSPVESPNAVACDGSSQSETKMLRLETGGDDPRKNGRNTRCCDCVRDLGVIRSQRSGGDFFLGLGAVSNQLDLSADSGLPSRPAKRSVLLGCSTVPLDQRQSAAVTNG